MSQEKRYILASEHPAKSHAWVIDTKHNKSIKVSLCDLQGARQALEFVEAEQQADSVKLNNKLHTLHEIIDRQDALIFTLSKPNGDAIASELKAQKITQLQRQIESIKQQL